MALDTATMDKLMQANRLQSWMDAHRTPKFKVKKKLLPKPTPMRKLSQKERNNLFAEHSVHEHWDRRTFSDFERANMTLEMFMSKKAGWKK